MFLTYSGMLSIGSITFDKNKNTEPKDIEAKVAVSSEVNKLPTSIPAKVKKDVTISNKRLVFGSDNKTWDLKNIKAIITIITNWNNTISMLVR